MNLRELAERARQAPLDVAEASCACSLLLDESLSVSEKAELLLAMRRRGETAQELAAFAKELLARCRPFPPTGQLLDVCGTGGDGAGTFNISTAVMFVAAGAGARVAKHGNRGITSRCGGADVLEALGVDLHAGGEAALRCLQEAGCCFFFAPDWHPAVKAVGPARAELARRGHSSIFNLLGPLLNPARPDFQLVGVPKKEALDLYGHALQAVGRRRAWAVHGTAPGGTPLDEISTLGTTEVVEVQADRPPLRFLIQPKELGLPAASLEDLRGADAAANAKLIMELLEGRECGPKRHIVELNAAAALVVAGLAASLSDGLERAREALDSGAALHCLETLRRCCRS